MKKDSITVILNGYKRGQCLSEQYDQIKNSTVKIDDLMLWYNYPGDDSLINYDITEKVTTSLNNTNLGVWARFAYALNAKTEYICMFDDDTIPGTKWFENCLNTMKTHEGLLGTIGLLYTNPIVPVDHCSYYDRYIRYGWNPANDCYKNEVPAQVDLVGHSWFFKREWLSMYWRDLPDPKYNLAGEDMHFSYMLQKYSNLKTYVPPHPEKDIQMWGNCAGIKYAADKNSMWETNQLDQNNIPFKIAMNQYYIEQRRRGWKLINEY